MAAQCLHHSKTSLGDFYRRLRAKLGAHKLARILCHLLTTQQEFDESRLAADQLHDRKRQGAKLRAKAKGLGFQLVPVEAAG